MLSTGFDDKPSFVIASYGPGFSKIFVSTAGFG